MKLYLIKHHTELSHEAKKLIYKALPHTDISVFPFDGVYELIDLGSGYLIGTLAYTLRRKIVYLRGFAIDKKFQTRLGNNPTIRSRRALTYLWASSHTAFCFPFQSIMVLETRIQKNTGRCREEL